MIAFVRQQPITGEICMATRTATPERRGQIGAIDSTLIYPLRAFMQAAGMSQSAMREARRRGLSVIRIGKRGFVRGVDWNAFLEKIKDAAEAS